MVGEVLDHHAERGGERTEVPGRPVAQDGDDLPAREGAAVHGLSHEPGGDVLPGAVAGGHHAFHDRVELGGNGGGARVVPGAGGLPVAAHPRHQLTLDPGGPAEPRELGAYGVRDGVVGEDPHHCAAPEPRHEFLGVGPALRLLGVHLPARQVPVHDLAVRCVLGAVQ